MVLRILSHFCGFQGLLEVTPIPCGLMEQTRNGPVARLVAGARAALPYGEGVENPEGGTEYPMRAARNNHAFAPMEPAEPLQRVLCLTGGAAHVVLATKPDHLRGHGFQHPLAVDAERLHPGFAGYWAGLSGHVVGPAHNVQGLLAEELMWFYES